MPDITAANSTPYLVPLTPQNQEFDLSMNGVTYHLIVKWNPFSACWELYIEDSQQNPIVSGIPLVTGCDLLEQYAYLGIGGAFVVQSSDSPDTVPDYASLGSTGNLFFLIPST
jgi:uncharacterized protein DUF6983